MEGSPIDDSSDSDEESTIRHSVVFKCIGSLKELRYQEILAQVAQRLRQGDKVSVQLQKEPNNPVDTQPIAFMCKLSEEWERIGYVVQEVAESVPDALDQGRLEVSFDWVKYTMCFSGCEWYAGIKMTRRGQWPANVLKCRAKSFD